MLKKISNEQKVKTTNQLIDNIYFRNLKCLQEVNISFAPKNVTAIFGPNGSGKSTILHALASLFQPEDNGENYRFSDFSLATLMLNGMGVISRLLILIEKVKKNSKKNWIVMGRPNKRVTLDEDLC